MRRFLWRLYGAYALLILVVVVIIGGLMARWTQQDSLKTTEVALYHKADLLKEIAKPHIDSGTTAAFQQQVRDLGQITKTRYTVIRGDGVVIADSHKDPRAMDNHKTRPEVLKAGSHGLGLTTRFSETLGREMMYLALPVVRDGEPIGYVRVAVSRAALEDRLKHVRTLVFVGTGVAGMVMLLLGYLLARRITAPVGKITRMAQAISGGDFSQRLEVPVPDEMGALAEALNSMTRQLKDRVNAIEMDRQKLSAILSSMVEGVVAVDEEERIVHINEAAGRILNCDVSQAMGKAIWEIAGVSEVSSVLAAAMKSAHPKRLEVRLDGGEQPRCLDLYATPLRNESDEVVGAVVVIYDVTELRRLEAVRRDFVGNVSHEFKTPVTAIRGLVETLLDDSGMDPATRKRFLKKINAQAFRLSTLVTDLLTLSRLESDRAVLEKETLDLRTVVSNSFQSMLAAAEAKSLTPVSQLPDYPVSVTGDRESLGQSVDNLLDNAIKYTPANGKITLRLSVEKDRARIDVADTGIGIEPVHQARIFERFYRADKARSREVGGTGLGLSIVKHTAMAHGGEVMVQSMPGRGSTFTVFIPLAQNPSQLSETSK